jgi:hypothetical protein
MNHLHYTNYHASTLSEIQRTIQILTENLKELQVAQNSPINISNLEGLVNSLKTKVDTLSANLSVLEGRVIQHDSKLSNIESRISFVESRDPKLPPSLESSLQLKLEHYLTKCVKERIDMLNIPGLKVQLEEKISNLSNQVQSMAFTPPPTSPVPPPTSPVHPPTSSVPLTTSEIETIVSDPLSSNEDIDISFKTRRQLRKPKA